MKRKTNTKRRKLINKKVLFRTQKNNNLINHAIKELKLAGYFHTNNGPSKWMRDQVLELLTVFASHGNSGYSAPIEISLFSKLANFDIITPLTFKDDEWEGSIGSDLQNKRKSSIFKDKDGRIHDIYAYNVHYDEQLLFGNSTFTKNHSSANWSGGMLFEVDGNDEFTGNAFCRCFLKEKDAKGKYMPKPTKTIRAREIEFEKDNWVSIIDANSNDIAWLAENYDIDWINFSCVKEVNIHNYNLFLDECVNTVLKKMREDAESKAQPTVANGKE